MAVIMVMARFLLANGTASTAVTTQFMSFAPSLRSRIFNGTCSIDFMTCTTFAFANNVSAMNQGSLLLIFRSICEETHEEEQLHCDGQEFPRLTKN
jgi:hypothetical protein